MSGAIDMLERSLKFNKRNIDARNLLGLVYYETGEVVSALSEWIISKNMMPQGKVAAEYISRRQENQSKLEHIQQSIRRYNRALDLCRADEEDAAVLTLKKVIEINPKLIKAYYLLSLIYMKQGEYEKAGKILKKSLPIDRTNSTALRFLKEIDEQTGTVTDTEDIRRGIVREKKRGLLGFLRRSKSEYRINEGYTTINWDDEENIISEPIVQPIAFRQLPAYASIVNIIIGIVLGAFIIGLIVVPAVKRSINRQSDERVSQYTQTLVTRNAYISSLESQIESLNAVIESKDEDVSEVQDSVAATQEVLNAYILYASKNYDGASELILSIDTELLTEEALSIYDIIVDGISATQYAEYYDAGYAAFQLSDFETAITEFKNALTYKENDYASLAYLAHSYRLNGDTDEAAAVFELIAQTYSGTTVAVSATSYAVQLEAGTLSTKVGISAVNTEIINGISEVES